VRRGAALWVAAGLLAAVTSLPAAAQAPARSAQSAQSASHADEWKVYSYPDLGFAFQLPVPPKVEQTTFQTATGQSLPARRYSARRDRVLYTLEVVDFSGTNADPMSTIAATEQAAGAQGTVTVAIDARVNRSHGRELSIKGNDGSHSAVAIFFENQHLYRLEGKSLAPDAINRSGDTIRFQESLQFIGANGGFGGFGGFGR